MNSKRKNIIGFILLFIVLVIIKLFLGGPNLNNLSNEILEELIVLIIISLILMIVPIIVRLKIKSKIEYKKGRKICLINSLIIYVLFLIPNLIPIIENKPIDYSQSFDNIAFSKSLILINIVLVIIYYFINICFFVENNKKL